jgi:putative ABC transport system permease protein
MLDKNIRTSARTLFRNRLYSSLNVGGLALGFLFALLIGLYVADEHRFDAQHSKADRIFKLAEENTSPEGRTTSTAATALLIAERAPQDFAEVEAVVKMGVMGRANVWATDPKAAFHEPVTHVDPSFGQVFDFKWLAGDRSTALVAPRSVVVTRSFALRTFGTENVLGKSLKNDFFESGDDLTVTGVLADFPKNSSIDFPFAISTASIENGENYRRMLASDWTSNNFPTWFLLQEGTDLNSFSKKLNDWTAANTPVAADAQPRKRRHFLVALRDIHFYPADISFLGERRSNPRYVRFLTGICLFLLGIACINYMNLTTARAASRSKEIGVRKAVGAGRGQMALQFLTETYLVVLTAFGLATVGLQAILPVFNRFADKNLTLNFSTDPAIWGGAVGSALLVGLLAGLYPAFYLARMEPVLLFRKGFSVGKWEFSMRKSLVVLQFGLSSLLIVAMTVAWKQIQFLDTKNLGFDHQQLVVVDINSGQVRRDFQTVKTGYAQIPGVSAVSVTSRVPGEWKTMPQVAVRRDGQAEADGQMSWFIGADADFLKTYKISLLAGRNFLDGAAADSNSVLLNESAARLLGIKEPAEQWLSLPSISFNGNLRSLRTPFRARVVGIVKDFHFQSLREKIEPLVIAQHSNPVHSIDYFSVRVNASNLPATLAQLEATLRAADPDHALEWHFLDEQWARFYADDRRRQQLLNAAAGVAILIACLGLFGLAAFTAERRLKEIGIRKVLGASVLGLTHLLVRDFLKLVVFAVLLAAPGAYFLMKKWLADFAYRIEIEWWMFAGAGLLAVGLAFLTVSFQSVRAALANPVKSLRSE